MERELPVREDRRVTLLQNKKKTRLLCSKNKCNQRVIIHTRAWLCRVCFPSPSHVPPLCYSKSHMLQTLNTYLHPPSPRAGSIGVYQPVLSLSLSPPDTQHPRVSYSHSDSLPPSPILNPIPIPTDRTTLSFTVSHYHPLLPPPPILARCALRRLSPPPSHPHTVLVVSVHASLSTVSPPPPSLSPHPPTHPATSRGQRTLLITCLLSTLHPTSPPSSPVL